MKLEEDSPLVTTRPTLKEQEKESFPLINPKGMLSRIQASDIIMSGNDFQNLNASFETETVIDLNPSRKSCVPFDPLDEEGERYLRENMTLPPIGELSPTKYYVNPHLSDSNMSSSGNSVSDWWNFMDYDDMEDDLEDGRVEVARARGVVEENTVDLQERKEFPLTENTIVKWKRRRKLEEEESRDQVIRHLEKQMVSLYKLKQQYRKNTEKKGCSAVEETRSGHPGLRTSDKLSRHRDDIINRMRRRMKEEENRNKSQIERKLNIVDKLLREQRKIDLCKEKIFRTNQEKAVLKETDQVKKSKSYKEFKISSILDSETSGEHILSKNNLTTHSNSLRSSKEAFSKDEQETGEMHSIPGPHKEPARSMEERKVFSLDNSQKATKEALDETVTSAAICEQQPELTGSQLEVQSVRFENWRENEKNQVRCCPEQPVDQLPEETCIEVKPSEVTIKDLQPRQIIRKEVTLTNVGKGTLQCRVAGISTTPDCASHPLFQVQMEGPSKARTGASWILSLTVETLREVEDTTAEVHLLLSREDDSRSVRTVRVVMMTPHAEPTLSTSCIRFDPQKFWNSPSSKSLHVSNTGGRGCVMRWELVASSSTSSRTTSTGKTSYSTIQTIDSKQSLETLPSDEVKTDSISILNAREVAETLMEEVFENVWSVFRINAWQNQVVPAKSKVPLQVTFVPSMSPDKGDVFAKYVLVFDEEGKQQTTQELLLCGTILDSPLSVWPDVLDMGVCYAGGGPQQALTTVSCDARHACGLRASVPSQLARWVTVLPTQTIVQAHSSIDLAVRFFPSTKILEDASLFLDQQCGLLSFPVQLSMFAVGWQPPPPSEVTVYATVLPLCPLTLSPASLDLGQISTFETVRAEISLVNYRPYPYTYAFLNLPERVQIEPGGGCGTIMGDEVLHLSLLYSPRAEDIGVKCGRPGSAGEINFTLQCFTTVSVAAPKQVKKSVGNINKRKVDVKTISMSSDSSKMTDFEGDSFLHEANDLNDAQYADLNKDIDESSRKSTLNTDFNEYNVSENSIVDETIEQEKRLDNNSVSASDGLSQTLSSKEEDLWNYYTNYQIDSDRKDSEEKSISNVVETEERQEMVLDDITKREDVSSVEENTLNLIDENIKEDSSASNSGGLNKSRSTLQIHFESSDFQKVQCLDVLTAVNRESQPGYPALLDQRCATLTVTALLVDPLVELSSQVVFLPPTPCLSQHTGHVYLRSRLQNQCSMHKKDTNFKTWFEFKSPSQSLTVEPKRGCIQYNQSTKISIIFHPTLSNKEIYEKALETKIENIKWKKIQDMLTEYYEAQAKKQKSKSGGKRSGTLSDKNYSGDKNKKGNKRSKSVTEGSVVKDKKQPKKSVIGSKTIKTMSNLKSSKVNKKDSGPLPEVIVNPEDVQVTEEDLRDAQIWLLKYLEPSTSTHTITCLLDTELGSGNRRQEVLECQVVCSVEAPPIVLGCTPVLRFGPTPLGVQSKLHALVTSISFFDVFVKLSTLNPLGPFRCSAALETPMKIPYGGVEVPPEHILSIPIVFQPVFPGEVIESFEVMSGNTVLRLEAQGNGVVPSYHITPDREVLMVTCPPGKKVDTIITIFNSCEAPLTFFIRQEYLKVGNSLPLPPSSPDKGPEAKREVKNEKKTKAGQEFETITPELKECLEQDFVDISADIQKEQKEPIFKIIDLSDEIVVPASDKKIINIRFTAPVKYGSLPPTEGGVAPRRGESEEQEKKNKKRDKKNTSPVKVQEIEKESEEKDKKNKKKMGDNKDSNSLNGQEKVKKSEGKEKKNKKNSKISDKQDNQSVKRQENKKNDKGKVIFAAKYCITFAEIAVAKEFVFMGSNKK